MTDIEEIIKTALVAIYSENILSETLYLKGGQALRVAHNLRSRFSGDTDFSIKESVGEGEAFFRLLRDTLYNFYYSNGLFLFDFQFTRRPKFRDETVPDFWGGWQVEFKLIEKEKMTLNLEDLRRQAIVPKGMESSKIKLDVSEYEYCGSIEKIKVGFVSVKTYSKVLIILEKIRAIAQQHPKYSYKGHSSNRARDYYDIERVYQKIIEENKKEKFLLEAATHLKFVFDAKKVSLELLDGIFDDSFVALQKKSWASVKATVFGKVDDFEYYNETLKNIIREIKKSLPKIKLF